MKVESLSYLKTYIIISLLENTCEKTGNNKKKTIQTRLLNFNLGKTNFTSDAVKDFTVTNLTFPGIGLFGVFVCLLVLIQPPNPSLQLCGTKIFFSPLSISPVTFNPCCSTQNLHLEFVVLLASRHGSEELHK